MFSLITAYDFAVSPLKSTLHDNPNAAVILVKNRFEVHTRAFDRNCGVFEQRRFK
jgi:hypothetical protein